MQKKPVGRPFQLDRLVETEEVKQWGLFACELIKQSLLEQGLGYRDLSVRLTMMELSITPEAVNRRINRGNISASFLLMCFRVLGITRIDFRDERLATTRFQHMKTEDFDPDYEITRRR